MLNMNYDRGALSSLRQMYYSRQQTLRHLKDTEVIHADAPVEG